MRRSALGLLALVLLAAGCGGGQSASEQPAYRAVAIVDRTPAADFALRDEHGRAVSMAAERGHWVIVTFLYTTCPDVCPVIAGNLNAVLRSAPARRAGLRVLSVSVDPEHDTPAAVRRYARQHRLLPSFRWVLGTQAQLARVWRDYDVAVLPGPKREVAHSSFELLIDPDGQKRLLYDAEMKTADVVHDLGLLVPAS
jgi:protein SCO1/2